MKKIVISLAIIGVVAGITLGITGAWFTDKEPIENNRFQAGTLDIKQGENDLPVEFANLMPGVATEPQRLTMGNDGSLDAVIDRIFVSAWEKWGTSAIEPGEFAQHLFITITDEVGRPLWKGRLYDLGVGGYPDGHGNAIDGTDKVFLAKEGTGENYHTRDYWFTFQLDSSVSDPSWQGADIKATFTVNATQVKDDEFDAAERLVMNQNNDNGWDWVENNEKTTVSSKNLFGVTAMGLLRAYEFSGNSKYFASAEKAAYILNAYTTGSGTTCWLEGDSLYNVDILFLQRMGKYYNTGNAFSTKSKNAVINRWNSYDNDAQKVYDAAIACRPSLPDIFYWDLAPLMEATIDVANTISDENQAMVLRNNALDLAALVAADQNPTGGWFITSWNNAYAQLGQASAVQILQLADDMSLDVDYSAKITLGITALLGQQQTDGSFKGGADGTAKKKSIQTTAYAALSLEMAGDYTNAQKAVDYIVSQQLSNGGWYEEEGEDEYPEVNSEALRAILSVSE